MKFNHVLAFIFCYSNITATQISVSADAGNLTCCVSEALFSVLFIERLIMYYRPWIYFPPHSLTYLNMHAWNKTRKHEMRFLKMIILLNMKSITIHSVIVTTAQGSRKNRKS